MRRFGGDSKRGVFNFLMKINFTYYSLTMPLIKRCGAANLVDLNHFAALLLIKKFEI